MIGVKIMIDFHSHILPGIDDGSQTVNETVEMLRMEKQQGCVKVIATPHFYADYDSAGRFLDKRAEALHKVQALREQEDWMPEIQAGAEVYFFSGIGRADILPRLCVEGTSLLLLEMPFAQWTRDMAREVQDIIKKQAWMLSWRMWNVSMSFRRIRRSGTRSWRCLSHCRSMRVPCGTGKRGIVSSDY